MQKTSFYFRVSADAGMAHDENGNNAEFFAQVSVDTIVAPEKMAEATEAARRSVAGMCEIDPQLVAAISKEEYEAAGLDDDPIGPIGDDEDDYIAGDDGDSSDDDL